MSSWQRAEITTQPASEPLSTDDAKEHLRVTHTAEDDLIAAYVTGARQSLEHATYRAFISQTWKVYGTRFPKSTSGIELPRAPVEALTSIKYIDCDGVEQTLSTDVYELVDGSEPPLIVLKYDQVWPNTREEANAVTIEYDAGFADASTFAAAEPAIMAALRLMVGHFYRNRESVIVGTIASELPMAVKSLIASRRVHTVV